MKTTLYEISDRYRGFMELVDSGEIEDMQAITDTLEAIQMEFDQKVDNIACLFKSLSAEADMIEAEAKRQLERAKYKRNVCDRLKAYVAGCMQSIGQEKFENERNKVSFSNSKSLDITDEEALYASLAADDRLDLVRIVTERKFDKTAIKKAISGGAAFDGAVVQEHKNLQIK